MGVIDPERHIGDLYKLIDELEAKGNELLVTNSILRGSIVDLRADSQRLEDCFRADLFEPYAIHDRDDLDEVLIEHLGRKEPDE